MSILDSLKSRARTNKKRIVFPEGDEPRTVQAAAILAKEGYADPVLIGKSEEIEKTAKDTGSDITGILTVCPGESPLLASYTDALYEIRRAKGLTLEEAGKLVLDPMYFGIMMVKMGDADGLVSGASHSTGDMLRPALQIIKTKPGIKVVSAAFLIESPNQSLGDNGVMIFSDGVVVPDPTAEELASIAVSSAGTACDLFGIEEPKVALLSFSTKGSAKHAHVTKVQEAVRLAHKMAPDILLDGEFQLDAALIPEIGASKAKGSPVAGYANVLIFPDLQSGNIGYKMAQRVGGATAVAVLQGLARPCNDLSRGCSVEDIVDTAVLTAVQAQV